jgi:hypothetical protein
MRYRSGTVKACVKSKALFFRISPAGSVSRPFVAALESRYEEMYTRSKCSDVSGVYGRTLHI